MNKFTTLLLLNFAFAPAGMAAGYSTNFNAGYNTGQELAGQQGWQIDDATPNLSFFVNWNTSNSGAVGGYHDAPAGASVRVSQPMSLPFAQSSLAVDLGVTSSTASYPGRDAFGMSAYNSGGINLLTVQFEPDVTDPNLLNITWFTGAGSPVVTGWAIMYDGPYHLAVGFAGTGADIQFTASVSSSINSFSFNGMLPGLAGETWNSVGSSFIVRGGAAGDNFMTFDNLAAVPEPSMGILLSGAAAATLLRRRRNSIR